MLQSLQRAFGFGPHHLETSIRLVNQLNNTSDKNAINVIATNTLKALGVAIQQINDKRDFAEGCKILSIIKGKTLESAVKTLLDTTERALLEADLTKWCSDANTSETKDRLTAQSRILNAYSQKATELDLSGLKLTSLPESIGCLTTLTRLDLSDNNLITLPRSINSLTALTRLTVQGNKNLASTVKTLLDKIERAFLEADLKKWCFDAKDTPEGKKRVEAKDLILDAYARKGWHARQATELNLRGFKLTTLPESIGCLSALTTLDLAGNSLTTLPESISRLTALARLDLDQNSLTALPESIGSLTALKDLLVGSNKLTTLPEWIKNLTALRLLYLNYNELATLPESISQMHSLTKIFVSHNKLTTLPAGLSELELLELLDVDPQLQEEATAIMAAVEAKRTS